MGRSGVGVAGCSGPSAVGVWSRLRPSQPAAWTVTATSPPTSIPTPAIHQICQNPAITPTKARFCVTTLVQTTGRDLVARCRDSSRRLTSTRAPRSGMATEKAPTQILAGRSSEVMIGAGRMCRDDRAVSQHLGAVHPGRYLAVGASSSPDAWSLPAGA